MRPFTFDVDPADVDPDGLADGNSSAGATVTLDGLLTSGGSFTSADSLAHRLDIIVIIKQVQLIRLRALIQMALLKLNLLLALVLLRLLRRPVIF